MLRKHICYGDGGSHRCSFSHPLPGPQGEAGWAGSAPPHLPARESHGALSGGYDGHFRGELKCPENQKGPKDQKTRGSPEWSPRQSPADPASESPGQTHGCRSASSAPHGPIGGGGTAEAAPGHFDPLAVTTGCPLQTGGAQIEQGFWQKSQAPCTGWYPQDAKDLPTRQHDTQEVQEDGGLLGGKKLQNPLGGEPGQGRHNCGL